MNTYFSSLKPNSSRVSSVRNAAPAEREAQLREFARELRVCVLNVIKGAGLGHVGGDFSAADTLVTLFGGAMNYDPANPQWAERDRFILSKGHCSASLYSVLAMCGFIQPEELATFAKPLSALNGHPNRNKVPGVETNTGPLGHGLPVAVGCAMAARLSKADWRTFVSSATANCRKAVTGKRSCSPATRACRTSPRSSIAIACSRARAPKTRTASTRLATNGQRLAGKCAKSMATTTTCCTRAWPVRVATVRAS